MRSFGRPVRLIPVAALALAVATFWLVEAAPVDAGTPSVTILDNDGAVGQQGFDPVTGYWGYGPTHVIVTKGMAVTFNSPATNKRPHSVTDIRAGESPFGESILAGSRFDSSPTREALIMPGNSWTLDTSNLDPGHYGYYCRLHPWMVGSLTVVGG